MKSGLIDLAIVTGTAPLLGLFGALASVIESLRSWGSPAWQGFPQVAAGLASALACLLAGLSVAMIANTFHRLLQARANTFQAEMLAQSNKLLDTVRPPRQAVPVTIHTFVERAMQRRIKQVDLELRDRLYDLATVATVAPLLGVSGAVYTIMKECFRSAGTRSWQVTLTTEGAADGLIWILAAIAISISASLAYRHFCNQAEVFRSEMQSESLLLLNRLPAA